MEANEEIEAAYMAESNVATAEELGDLLRADIGKTEEYCKQKTKEVKLLIQETLVSETGRIWRKITVPSSTLQRVSARMSPPPS